MICKKYKCLFVHIPKTAGQSIESVFLRLSGLDWETRASLLLKPNLNKEEGPPRLAHLTAQEYLKYGYISKGLFDSYFKFSFVRNPWARLVSEYKFSYSSKYDFKRFLFEHFPEPEDDIYFKSEDHYRHVMPQYKFIYDSNGICLVDYIGRFENLQHDFNLICPKISISEIVLPDKNKSLPEGKFLRLMLAGLKRAGINPKSLFSKREKKKIHYTEYYDDESEKFVAELYKKDIEMFSYEFGR